MGGDRLIKTIQNMAKLPTGETTDLFFGEVTSIAPLKVKIDNRFEIDENFLILSAFVKETVINIPTPEASTHTHVIPIHSTLSAGEHPHTHSIPAVTSNSALPSIRLWRGLIIGDKVRLLRVNNGQMFYIIEREEDVV